MKIRALAFSFLGRVATAASAEVVGKVGVDWVGNDIIVEAVPDPKVQGVTCHVAYFSRSVLDRLSQGNWFEDPSYSAIDCTQTGPITVGDIDKFLRITFSLHTPMDQTLDTVKGITETPLVYTRLDGIEVRRSVQW